MDYKQIFDQWDADGSGELSPDEVAGAMNACGLKLAAAEVSAIFNNVDVDESGTIDFDEFLEFASIRIPAQLSENLTLFFKHLDADGSGRLNREEFARGMRVLTGDEVSDVDVDQAFDRTDADGNGVIDISEFERLVTNDRAWNQLRLTTTAALTFREITEQYTRLARSPESGFGTNAELPYGRENAREMGYEVEALPDGVWASSCMCGNPFDLVELKPGQIVVDLGCGAGVDLCVASRTVGETGQVYGIDVTPAMVEKSKQNVELCGVSNVEVIQGSFDMGSGHPDLPEGKADVVIFNGTLNLSNRQLCAVRQALRCLKPGGVLAVCDVVLPAGEERSKGADKPGAVCDCVAGARPIPALLELFTKGGFTDCEHIDYTPYQMPEGIRVATFRARKPLR